VDDGRSEVFILDRGCVGIRFTEWILGFCAE
jgi:hypothetical protein